MKLNIKNNIKKVYISLNFNEFVSFFDKSPKILFWHGVDNVIYPEIEPENVNVPIFLKQLEYLKKRYEIISIMEFNQRYNEKKLTGKEIVLTFDDGYKNNYSVLAPIMYDQKLPFTIFVTTKNIDTGDFFATSLIRIAVYSTTLQKIDIPTLKSVFKIETNEQKKSAASDLSKIIKNLPLETVNQVCNDIINSISIEEHEELKHKHKSLLPLTWNEVVFLSKEFCTIGSHCIDHICCHSKQDNEEVRKQIFVSKQIIESKIGADCNYFAYPNGDYTEFSNECVKTAGYKLGFSTKKIKYNSYNFNISSMPRQIAQNNLDTFKILINYYGRF